MREDLFSVKGKHVVLIHADTPYGRQLALGLNALGAAVTLCGTNREELRALVKDMGLGEEQVIPYDPGTEQAAQALTEKVSKNFGAPDALIIINPGSALNTWTPEFDLLYHSLRVSQLGLMLTVKHLGLLMAGAGRGAVLFVTDYGALVGYDPENYREDSDRFRQDFALDAGFIAGSYVNYARQAAGFLGEHGIRCNTLALGALPDKEHDNFMEAVIRHSHIKRPISQEDITAAAAFLISDASSFITGVTLPVDGGYTAK